PPVTQARDRVHGAVAGHHVHQREPRPRDRAIRRRRFEPGAPGRRGRAQKASFVEMSFLAELHFRAAAAARRIVFPESADERTRTAVSELARRGIVRPILVLDPAVPQTHDAVRALGVDVIDPTRQPLPESVLNEFLSHHAARGITKEECKTILHTPLHY